jgi:hypothetical protein
MNIDPTQTVIDPAILGLIDKIGRGMFVIDAVDEINYRRNADGTGSVGAQFRYDLDFVTCLLKGIETGRLNYCECERDVMVENDRQHARSRFSAVSKRLHDIDRRLIKKVSSLGPR